VIVIVIDLPLGADLPATVSIQRQQITDRGGGDAGNGADAIEDIVDEYVLLLKTLDLKTWVDAQRGGALGLKS
jgi:hypothetical protein